MIQRRQFYARIHQIGVAGLAEMLRSASMVRLQYRMVLLPEETCVAAAIRVPRGTRLLVQLDGALRLPSDPLSVFVVFTERDTALRVVIAVTRLVQGRIRRIGRNDGLFTSSEDTNRNQTQKNRPDSHASG